MNSQVAPTDTQRHPQVLHIGFSKCASTYLRALFRSQPHVHMVFKSGFFTPHLSGEMTFGQYQALFRDEPGIVNVESDEHLTLPGVHPELGVRTTNLDEVRKVADRIRDHLPEVRILMVVRNQASLMVSRYSEYLITGGSLGFDEFADSLMGFPGAGNFHYQNHYSKIIEVLEARFPRDHLLVLLQEAMRLEKHRTQSAIARLLGRENLRQATKGLRSERRSLSVAGMLILRNINRFFVSRSSVGSRPPATRIPLRAYQFIVKGIRGIDFYVLARISRSPDTLMTKSRRLAILSHFREDNLRLQERLGVNLAALGYFAEAEKTCPS